MNFSFPLEIRSDGKFYLDDTPSDGLNVCFELKSGELMYELVNDLAHLGELDNLADLLRTHVVEVLPGKLFLLLNFAEYFFGNAVILPERGHRAPLPPLDHLACIEESLTKL